MKMLKHYLETQKNKLDDMQQRQAKLYQQQVLEHQRFDELTGHSESLAITEQMNSTLALQNLSAARQQINNLCLQQSEKMRQAEHEWQRQLQACHSQARFNVGIQTLVDKQLMSEDLLQRRKEQKQQDELVNQLHSRAQQSSNIA